MRNRMDTQPVKLRELVSVAMQNRLWRVDPREEHQARVNAMMSQVLDLQDRIAALAVTAPVGPSPRASLPGGPATAAQALQRELRIPRLMMTRSLPSSIEAALAQLGQPCSHRYRVPCMLLDSFLCCLHPI